MKLNNIVMMGMLPGFLLYIGVVAEAKLVVRNQDELLLSRLVVDGWWLLAVGCWLVVVG